MHLGSGYRVRIKLLFQQPRGCLGMPPTALGRTAELVIVFRHRVLVHFT
jgi:hypothetical protein